MITRLKARCKSFFSRKSQKFVLVSRGKKKQNKNEKCLIATRFVILLVYIYEQNNVKVVIKNTALIQWHKLKKETPSIAYIDMLNGIIPGHAFKISWESDWIEGRLPKYCSAASITNQILNRKGNCKNRKGHEEKLCRLTILKSKVISVEKWEVDLCAI